MKKFIKIIVGISMIAKIILLIGCMAVSIGIVVLGIALSSKLLVVIGIASIIIMLSGIANIYIIDGDK